MVFRKSVLIDRCCTNRFKEDTKIWYDIYLKTKCDHLSWALLVSLKLLILWTTINGGPSLLFHRIKPFLLTFENGWHFPILKYLNSLRKPLRIIPIFCILGMINPLIQELEGLVLLKICSLVHFGGGEFHYYSLFYQVVYIL